MHTIHRRQGLRLSRFFGALACVAGLMTANGADARPALLFDAGSGKILYAEDQDHVWHPASLTKIMTAYLTFEAIKAGKITPQTKLNVSELAHAQTPSKVGLPVGATMSVELALQALIVKSANDVAVMLAEGIGGTAEQFVADMNATAKRLGMSKTVFVNPNGLPAPEQVTTARDLGKLARAVLRDFPEYAPLWAQADMRIGRLRLRTHNNLLKTYEGADGLKTGFTCDSGYNVVATAQRDGRKIVAIVLGSASGRDRNLRAADMMEHGFQTTAWRQALAETPTIDTLPIAADARAMPTSVRDTVTTWDCGGRKRRPAAVAKSKQKRQTVVRTAKAAPGEQAATGATAATTTGTTAGTPAASVPTSATLVPAAPVAKRIKRAQPAADATPAN